MHCILCGAGSGLQFKWCLLKGEGRKKRGQDEHMMPEAATPVRQVFTVHVVHS